LDVERQGVTMAEIVDNSPELDLADPATTEILANLTAPQEEKPEAKDVKEKVEVSSTPAQVEKEEIKDPEAQIKGLKAELSRRQGNADKVHELEVELARLQGELKAAPKTAVDPVEAAIQKLDDKDLIERQADWEAELSIATSKWERADNEQNQDALRLAGERITRAKQMLSRLRVEMVDRSDKKHTARTVQAKETETITSELTGMYDMVAEAFPDFQKEDSPLWQAGKEFYDSNPILMSKLGPAGEVVAAAMAIIKNPTLSKGGDPETRKAVLKSIDKGFGKVLSRGTTSPTTNRTVDYSGSVSSAEGLAKFEDMITKLKGG
jgi:hypothetical protein